MMAQWYRRASAMVVCVFLAAGLTACIQENGGVGSGGGGGGDLAGGGIGGTGNGGAGFGEITGFGSILFNDDSRFKTDDATEFLIDGDPVKDEDAFRGAFGIPHDSDEPVGAVAIVEVRDVDADFTEGTAVRVDARTAIKGPVTNTNPLQVLGQTVVVTGGTVLADLPGGIGDLSIGNEVEVSGFTGPNNQVLATRIQLRQPGELDEWKLTGFVTPNSIPDSFHVGAQTVSLNDDAECGDTVPQPGQFVEIEAHPLDHSNFDGGTLIASRVECKPRGLAGELDDSGLGLRRVQGFVSSNSEEITDRFTIAGTTGSEGQEIRLTTGTTYHGGTVADLVTGVKVEITGQFDVVTGVLTATRVSFRETRVRIEAPLFPDDLSADTVTLLGITIHRTALTEVDDKLLDPDNLPAAVRLRGYVDRDGTVYATEIDHRDKDPFDRDLRLRGPVDNDSISSDDGTFRILGVQVMLNGNPRFKDNDAILNREDFFAILELTPGRPVQVDVDIECESDFEAVFTPNPPQLSHPSEIELED